MFTQDDIYFVLDKINQDKIFYKNKIFYSKCLSGICPLDELYNTNFVCMSKISYYIRKNYKNYDYITVKKILIYLDFIAYCLYLNIKYNVNINLSNILTKDNFPNMNIKKLNKIFYENDLMLKTLEKLVIERNKIY